MLLTLGAKINQIENIVDAGVEPGANAIDQAGLENEEKDGNQAGQDGGDADHMVE